MDLIQKITNQFLKKNIMKALLTFALVLSLGASTFATEKPTYDKALSHVQAKEKTVFVHLGQELGKVRLTIIDSKGKKIHQRTLNVKTDIRIPFDLSQLPEGKYQVEVEPISKDKLNESQIFDVVTKEAAAPMVLPLVASGKLVKDGKIKLAVFGLEEPGLDVKIKTQQGRLLHEEKINVENGFIRFYQFKGVRMDGIRMELKDVKGREKTLYF